MKIENYKNPFYHTIITDFYNKEEENLIWEELEFLNKPGKLLGPESTGDPLSSPNKKGIFLDDLFSLRKEISNILTINNKIFDYIHLMEDNPFCKYFNIYDKHKTLLSYYTNGAYYDTHFDCCTISSVLTFWKTPKQFSGGELIFTDYNYIPNMDHNTMIIFPSFEFHSVTEIEMGNDDTLNGRYSINQFFSVGTL